MDIAEFTSYIISNIVSKPDMVKVSCFESDEDSSIIEVIVASCDMGVVLGKNGKNAKALRNMVNAYAYLHKLPRAKINIDSF